MSTLLNGKQDIQEWHLSVLAPIFGATLVVEVIDGDRRVSV